MNFGLRFEHEDGLREVENRQAVAFDESVVNPLNAIVPKTGLLAGRTSTASSSRSRRRTRGAGRPGGVEGRAARRLQLLAEHQDGPAAATACSTRRGTTAEVSTARRLHARHVDESVRPRDRGADLVVGEPVPVGLIQPIGSGLGLLTNTGGIDPLRRPEQGQPEGAPVLVRRPARAARQHGGHHRLHRRHRTRHRLLRRPGGGDTEAININQIDPAVARAAFPGPNGRRTPRPCAPTSPTRSSGSPHRRVRQPADDSGRPAPAAVPAVRRHLQLRDDRRRTTPVPRRDVRAERSAPLAGGAAGSAIR